MKRLDRLAAVAAIATALGYAGAANAGTDWNVGDTVTFDRVLLLSNEGDVKVGTPHVGGASVTAEVLGPVKGKKEVVFRFKRRKNVRVKRGHRQGYTQVRITQIDS